MGTVEVRITDIQSTIADTAALVVLVRLMARLELEAEPSPVVPRGEG